MAKTQKAQVVITANAAVAKKIMDELKQRVDALKRQMDALDVSTAKGQKEFKKLEKELISYNSAVQQNITNTERINSAMKNLSNTSLTDLKRALAAAKSELNKMSANSKGLKEMQNNVKALQGQIDKLSVSTKSAGSAFSSLIKHGTQMIAMYTGFNAVINTIKGIFTSNLKLSDQLADIRKVSGLLNSEVQQVSKSIMGIKTRTAVSELNKLAYTGSKLGIAAQYGVEGLIGFTKAADQLAVALHEDLGDDAINQVSKMTQVMGDMDRMGVEKSLLSTSSAIFKLSSSTTSNGANIVQFSKRLVGLAKASQISTPQILGLASAADSMMLMPEVASTAMSKFITSLQTSYHIIEKDLQLPKDALKSLLEQNKIVDAMVLVFEKMNQMGNMNALNFMFKDMGSDGARLKNVMVTMAQNTDMLRQHLQLANNAFKEGNAVTMEYVIQQNSAAAFAQRASNEWSKLAANADLANGSVKELAQAWYNFSSSVSNSSFVVNGLKIALTAIAKIAELLFAGLVPFAAFMFGRLIPAMIAATTAGHGLAGAFINMRNAWASFMTFMKANIWGVIAASLYNLVSLLTQGNKFTQEAEERTKALARAQSECEKEYKKEIKSLKELYGKMTDANKPLDARKALLETFNSKYGTYLGYQVKDISNTQELAKAYQDAQTEMRKYMKYKNMLQVQDIVVGQPRTNAQAEFLNAKSSDETLQKLSTEDFETLVGMAMRNIDPKTGKKAFKTADDIARWIMEDNPYGLVGAKGDYNRSGIELFGRQWTLATQNGSANPSDMLTHAVEQMMTSIEGKMALESDKYWKEVLNYTPPTSSSSTFVENTPATAPEDDSRANISEFITKIKNFYERQITVLTEDMTRNEIDDVIQQRVIGDVKTRMRDALAAAQQSIVLGKETWDEFKKTMESDIKEKKDEYGSSQSHMLYEAVTTADVAKLRSDLLKQMPKIKKGQVVGMRSDERDRAYLDNMWLEATKDEQKNATWKQQQMQARKKELREHDYTGTVDNQTMLGLVKSGFVNINPDNYAVESNQVYSMLANARGYMSEILSGASRNNVMEALFAGGIPPSSMISLDEANGEDWGLFIQKLVQYFDEYTQAQKRADNERAKNNAYLWSVGGGMQYANAESVFASNKSARSRSDSFGATGGQILPWQQDYSKDPEVMLWMIRLDGAQKYYDFIESMGASDAQKAEQAKEITETQSKLMDAVVAKAKATAEAQMKWYKPLEEYGTGLGEALADDTKSVKEATGEMIKSFIKLTGEYVNQKLTQWIMTKLYNGLMADEEQALVVKEQAAASASVTTQAAKTEANVALGTAEASAKTLGELGWWGIPLIAVITAVLNGLLSFAMSKVSSAFGGGGKTGANTKLVSGMLTYDSGNVQSYAGSDGQVYSAQAVGRLSTGIVSSPIATTVNGAPALVGERGPEIVVGRETTAAIMRNDPGLLRMLVGYDKLYSGRRQVFDDGNVSDTLSVSGNSSPDSGMASLMAKLLYRLDNPVAPNINMYGRDGLHSKMQQANAFMKGR